MAAPGATAELSAKHIAELRGQPCSGIPPALASGRGSLHPEKALPHRRGASAGGPAVLSCVLSFEALTQTLWSKEALWNWTDANVSLKEAPGAWAGAFGPVTERRGSSLCPPRALAQPLLLAGRPVHQTGHTSHPLIPGVLLDSPGTGGTAGLVGEQGLGPSLLLRVLGVLDSVRHWVNVTNTTATEPSWALRAQRQPRPAGTEPRPPTHQRCPEPGAHSPAPSGRNRPPQHCAQRRERRSVHTDFIPKSFSFRKIELISHESSCFI